MQSLEGKKVWVIQYDDEEDAVLGICLGVDQNFIALRQEHESDPSLFINLTNVKEIEVFRADGEGELRYLRAVKDEE
jgi:hypothetical protein